MKATRQKIGGIVSIVVVLVMLAGVVVATAYQDGLIPSNGYSKRYGQGGQNQRSLPNYHTYDGSYPCPWVRDYHSYRSNVGHHGWCQNSYKGYESNHYRYYRW